MRMYVRRFMPLVRKARSALAAFRRIMNHVGGGRRLLRR